MLWSAERGLGVYGRRSSAVARTAVVVVCGALAPLAVPQRNLLATGVVAIAAVGWNLVYCHFMVAGRSRGLVPADVAITCVVCLSQHWTVPSEALSGSASWVFAVVQVTVLTYQWHTGSGAGAVASVLIVGAYLGGALPSSTTWVQTLAMGVWLLVGMALSRGLFVLVRRGGRRADAIRARGERVRHDAAVSTARRADAREYLACLHDTAAATLMMVGMGMVSGREPWLSEQAGRDLELLTEGPDVRTGEVDLVAMLRPMEGHCRLRIEWTAQAPLMIPYVPAVAICHSVRETLTNVRRHAGVDTAAVCAQLHDARIVVEVTDTGRGFDPGKVSPQRRGLSHSIIERMDQVGGSALVSSRPGRGTVVRLEWPGG